MKSYHIYAVIHKIKPSCYIGITVDPKARWLKHLSDAKLNRHYIRFHHALRKYGKDAFEWTVFQIVDTLEEANLLEIYWISYLRDLGLEIYNMTEGGDGHLGHSPSEETKQILREANAGSNNPMWGRKGEKHPLFKVPRTEETKNRIRDGRLGFKHSDETKVQFSKQRRGKGGSTAKLTLKEVEEIRVLLDQGISGLDIAKKYNVRNTSISNIKIGKTWKKIIT